jgi:arylsulfatase A-like enzyme
VALLGVVGLLAVIPAGAPIERAAAEEVPIRPNIVLIVADDMRADQMDTMPIVQSQLVDKGRTFSKAFTTGPICCPSRGSFLRGQYVHTHTMYETIATTSTSSPFYKYSGGHYWKRVGLDRASIATWLDELGYFTIESGKYVNGYPGTTPPPGWDYWRQKSGQYANFKVVVSGKNVSYGANAPAGQPACSQSPCYEADVVTDHAIAGIRASGETPLFMWLGYFAPHSPWTPPLRYDTDAEAPECANEDHRGDPSFNEAGKDTDKTTDKPRWVRRSPYSSAQVLDAGVTRMVKGCRALLAVDDGIGRVLDALAAKDPGLDNTIILFTSDQGVQSGNHMQFAKKVPYEETIRLPFVVRADRFLAEAPSTDDEHMVLNIDVAPTFLELAGHPDPSSVFPGCPNSDDYFEESCLARGGRFDGYSFAPLVDPSLGPYVARTEFLIEHWDPLVKTTTGTDVPAYCGVRTDDAKLVRYWKGAAWGFDWEGYDLAADPFELHSLVYSGRDGIPKFRGRGGEIYRELLPRLIDLCDPRPPEYPPF